MHGVFVALISFNWSDDTVAIAEVESYYIDATIVEQNPYATRQLQGNEKLRKKIKQRRIEEAEIKRLQQNWELEKQGKEIETAVPEPVIEVESET